AHALAQHQSRLHRLGRRGLAPLLRRAGSASRGTAHRAHRRRRRGEVRRLAAIDRRVREAVRRRVPELADQELNDSRRDPMESTLQQPVLIAPKVTPKASAVAYWIRSEEHTT